MCDIRVISIYMFSIENFKRPKGQLDALMEIIKIYLLYLSKRGGLLDRYGARMRVLGRLELLEEDMLLTIQRATDRTRNYGDKIINVYFSYTSRDEIAGAIRQTVAGCKIPVEADNVIDDLVRDSSTKRSHSINLDPNLYDGLEKKSLRVGHPMAIYPQNITTKTLTDHMLNAGDPPLDLLIRTSGAHRLSDFLLWQCHEKTRILFPETLWPDFGRWQLFCAIREWQRGEQKLMADSSKVCKHINCFKNSPTVEF